MIYLRATRKVLQRLSTTPHDDAPTSRTALGDWYVNRVVVDRRPLLLLVSSMSYLPITILARQVQQLPDRLPHLVEERLHRLGVSPALVRAEVTAMPPVVVGRTCDRSVVGILTDFCRMLPFYLPGGEWDEDALAAVDERLAETPCHATRRAEEVVLPDRKTGELLSHCWT